MTSPGFECAGGLEGFMNYEVQSHGDKTFLRQMLDFTSAPTEDGSQHWVMRIGYLMVPPTGPRPPQSS
jgi:hypothetical protein